jgi:hypothetical protein
MGIEVEVAEGFYCMTDTLYMTVRIGRSGRGLHIMPEVQQP